MTAKAGNSTTAISASSGWTNSSMTRATPASTTTLSEKASGLSTMVAVNTSASAWASSSPAGRSRWKLTGASR